jgi:hypothetical protein
VIGAGERIPSVRVWIEPGDDGGGLLLDSLATDGPFLVLVYLYDWTST